MKKKNKISQHHGFTVAGFHFECDNYCDWKPGLQLSLESPFRIVLNVDKTFRTPEAVEKYVRETLLKTAKKLVKELERTGGNE